MANLTNVSGYENYTPPFDQGIPMISACQNKNPVQQNLPTGLDFKT